MSKEEEDREDPWVYGEAEVEGVDVALYDPPTDEAGVQDLLEEALTERLSDLCGGRAEPQWRILMTPNKGLILRLGNAEFQIQVVRSK